MAETQEEKRRRLIQEGAAASKAAKQGVKKVGAGLSSAAVAAAQGINTGGEAVVVNPILRGVGAVTGGGSATLSIPGLPVVTLNPSRERVSAPQPTPPSAVGVASAVTPRPATPPMEQNWSKPLLLAEKMEQRYSPIAPLPASTQPRTTTPGPVIPEPDPLAPKPGDMLARRIEFAKELKGQVSSGKYDQEGARKKASELGITPEDFGRFAKRELWPTPTPTPTPKPAPAASTLSPDLIAARASFGRQLDQQSMSGGFNLEDAQRDAAALSITPEQFNAFVAARKPLSQMRAQQERQQVEAIGSSSALNLRRGLQTEAGRMRSVGRQVGRDIKRGMDPEFARQAGLLKMTTPGIRSVDQGIAEREGQEKTAAAFQANENQYAKLMQDADTDPDLKRKLDRMLAKRAKKAA